jgi:hypothetical protein
MEKENYEQKREEKPITIFHARSSKDTANISTALAEPRQIFSPSQNSNNKKNNYRDQQCIIPNGARYNLNHHSHMTMNDDPFGL